MTENIYTNGHVAELAKRTALGENPDDIIKSFTDSTMMDKVVTNAEISWIKSVGECEAFLMASMYQHHVNLSRGRANVLNALLDAIVEGTQGVDDLKASYDLFNHLVISHEDRMNELKQEWFERRDTSKG